MGIYGYEEHPFNNTDFQTYLLKIEGLKNNRIEFIKRLIINYGNMPITDEEIMDLKIDLGAYNQRIERERKEKKEEMK